LERGEWERKSQAHARRQSYEDYKKNCGVVWLKGKVHYYGMFGDESREI